jgi:hypothetical protein
MLFVHLKQDLQAQDVGWVTAPEPQEKKPPSDTRTKYEIDRATQLRLASLRTDLDSFTHVEAYALMCSGYLATRQRLFDLDAAHAKQGLAGDWGYYGELDSGGDWEFLKLRNTLALPTSGAAYGKLPHAEKQRADLLTRQLEAGAELFFKVWRLSAWLRPVAWVLGLVLLGAAGRYIYLTWDKPLPQFLPETVGALAMSLGLLLLALLVPSANYLLNPQKAARGLLWRLGAATAGWVVSGIHLLVFDRMFMNYGSMAKGSKSLFDADTRICKGRESVLPAAPAASSRPRAA